MIADNHQPLGCDMRIYVAGPMTGYEHYNHRAFAYAQERWQAEGHVVVTPFDANSRVWFRHHGRPFDPRADTCDWGDPVLGEMFAEDVQELLAADAVVLLAGWEKSRGARLECAIGKAVGKRFILDATGEDIDPDVVTSLAAPAREESALQEAQRLVHGDRGAAYGHPIDDYTRTGRMWGAILGLPDIDPRLCCLMMAAVKISREVNAPKRDNRVDLAGYAECAQMVAERQGKAA